MTQLKSVPDPPDKPGDGTGETEPRDDEEAHRQSAFRAAVADLKPPLPAGYKLPRQYELDPRGVREIGSHGRKPVASAPIVLTRVLVDPDGLHMTEIAWKDRGKWVRRVVPRVARVSGKALVTALADAGLPVTSAYGTAVERYLGALESDNQAVLEPELIARHLGWQPDGSFVVADGNPVRCEPAIPQQVAWLAAHGDRGTLTNWLDVVKAMEPYPVAQMVLCAGFTPVLLRVLGVDSHTVDVSGRSTRGKTTAAKAAFSLWGDPSERADGIFSWQTTPTGIEFRLNLVDGLPVVVDACSAVVRVRRPGALSGVEEPREGACS